MGAYFILLGIIILQWMLLYPNRIITFNYQIEMRQRKWFCILACVELICFAGIRTMHIGADTAIYIKALEYLRSIPRENILYAKLMYPFDFEIGYAFLTKICAALSMSNTEFLYLIAMIIYIPVFVFIFYYSSHPLISTLTYFALGIFGYSLGIFRQMIAISIILCGLRYIEERKLLKYCIYIFIAMLFHTTAIIALPLYWLFKFNIKNKLMWIITLEVVILFFSRIIVLFIVKIFPSYSGYINSQYDIQGGSYIMLIIFNIILIIAYYMVRKGQIVYCGMGKLAVNSTICMVYLQIMGYSMEIFGRIIPYYSIFLLILVPCILENLQIKNKPLLHILCIGVLLMMFYYTNNNAMLVPFTTIFSEKVY